MLTPQTIVFVTVEVPARAWGAAIDHPDKARDLVDRYTFATEAYEVVEVEPAEDGNRWQVLVRFESSDTAAVFIGIALDSQFDRYRSGGLTPRQTAVLTAATSY